MTALVTSEARVPVAAYQQVPGQDLTAMGTLPQGSLDNVVENILIAGVGYTGLGVSQVGTSTILTVDPGYLIKGGPAFSLRDAFQVDVAAAINAVPDSAKFIKVAIVADGQEFQTQETRTFVDASKIPPNPTTPAPTTTQSTPTRIVRAVVISSPKGAADVQPDLPSFSSTLCLLATVIVSNTGIVSVVQNTATQITRLDQLVAVITGLTSTVTSQASQISNLQALLSGVIASDEKQFANLQAELVALQQQVNALATRQTTTAAGATYSQTEYFLNASLSTGTAAVGSGLTFPSTGTTAAIAPLNPLASNIKITPGNKLTYPWTELLAEEVNGSGWLNLNLYAPLTAQPMLKGFGVERTRYGAALKAEPYAQAIANGNPTSLFSSDPTKLVYDPSWAYWAGANPILSHQNGYWDDLTCNDYWTPRSPLAPIVATSAVAQRFIGSGQMLTSYDIVVRKGTQGDIRLLICDDLNGKPDLGSVLVDVTVPYNQISSFSGFFSTGTGCNFVFDYPIYTRKGGIFHRVLVSNGDHKIGIYTSADVSGGNAKGQPGNAQLEALVGSGTWSDIPDSIAFNGDLRYASFPLYPAAIPLQYISQAYGIDLLDLVTPAIVPPGCDIQFGVIGPNGVFQELGPIASASNDGQPNILALHPTTVGLQMKLLGNSYLSPVLDLGTSVSGVPQIVTGKQSGEFIDDTPTYNWPAPVTTITDTVVLQSFDPAFHTYDDKLEYGAGFATPLAPTSVSTPMKQADGTTLITSTWALSSAVSTHKIRRHGLTSDASKPFKATRADVTAK